MAENKQQKMQCFQGAVRLHDAPRTAPQEKGPRRGAPGGVLDAGADRLTRGEGEERPGAAAAASARSQHGARRTGRGEGHGFSSDAPKAPKENKGRKISQLFSFFLLNFP